MPKKTKYDGKQIARPLDAVTLAPIAKFDKIYGNRAKWLKQYNPSPPSTAIYGPKEAIKPLDWVPLVRKYAETYSSDRDTLLSVYSDVENISDIVDRILGRPIVRILDQIEYDEF